MGSHRRFKKGLWDGKKKEVDATINKSGDRIGDSRKSNGRGEGRKHREVTNDKVENQEPGQRNWKFGEKGGSSRLQVLGVKKRTFEEGELKKEQKRRQLHRRRTSGYNGTDVCVCPRDILKLPIGGGKVN